MAGVESGLVVSESAEGLVLRLPGPSVGLELAPAVLLIPLAMAALPMVLLAGFLPPPAGALAQVLAFAVVALWWLTLLSNHAFRLREPRLWGPLVVLDGVVGLGAALAWSVGAAGTAAMLGAVLATSVVMERTVGLMLGWTHAHWVLRVRGGLLQVEGPGTRRRLPLEQMEPRVQSSSAGATLVLGEAVQLALPGVEPSELGGVVDALERYRRRRADAAGADDTEARGAVEALGPSRSEEGARRRGLAVRVSLPVLGSLLVFAGLSAVMGTPPVATAGWAVFLLRGAVTSWLTVRAGRLPGVVPSEHRVHR